MKKRGPLGLALLASALCVALLLGGCARSAVSGPVHAAKKAAAPRQAQAPSGSGMRGNFTSAVATGSTGPSSLADARSQVATSVKFPPQATAGAAEMVVTDGVGQVPRRKVGISVRYPGDVEFFAGPGLSEYQFNDFSDSSLHGMVFADGRTKRFETIKVAGRTMYLGRGGAFTSAGGVSGAFPAALTWRDGDTEYSIESNSSSPERLIKVAESIYLP